MIFISAPYSSPYNEVIKDRVKAVSLYCGELLKKNIMCITPILHGDKILEECNLPKDFNFWDKISFAYLDQATEIHVIMLRGWDSSTGVLAEIEHAKKRGIVIKYITYNVLHGIPFFGENQEILKQEKLANKLRESLNKEQ